MLQIAEFLGVEEFPKADAHAVAEHFDGNDTGVLTLAVRMFFTAEGEEGTVPPWRAAEVFLGDFG